MARYRKIEVRIWGDEKFNELSKPKPNGQSLWFYLLTCPGASNIPGIVLSGQMGLAEALGWDADGFRKAFDELMVRGMIEADLDRRLIWVVNAIFYNQPESPNVILGWESQWSEVPECPLKKRIAAAFLETFAEKPAHLDAVLKIFGIPSWIPSGIPSGIPIGNQKQKQKQKQKQEQNHLLDSNAFAQSPKNGDRPASPEALSFVLGRKGEWREDLFWVLTEAKVKEYEETFPTLNVLASARKAKQWLVDNPSKRKTARGMPKFLFSWFERNLNWGKDTKPGEGRRGFVEPKPIIGSNKIDKYGDYNV